MEVKYLNQEEFRVDIAPFSAYIKRLSKSIELMDGVLNVVFVNDKYIRALNNAYRGKDAPTDVLSFSYGPDSLIGEVYVSVETAERQAKDYKHSLSDELARLIVHGILHVHDYDHNEDEDYKEMFAVEKMVLGKIAGEETL
ncbi:rRNA maturation RNase YbeY [Patescibacteria group bacterium]|nr:rRNA maturation RNase YbeY [Patescibacteria group bacterium]MBU1015679.1 rRNA maturation RNase YbeY [Patescibacteria group bacterium]MBU1684737.1 rRNA maturation RNase YbeY [Patescibacteria group bacterium]MBU1938743.1 rRNA maturation RNase YbeY [Patescibacteria group bacterium]